MSARPPTPVTPAAVAGFHSAILIRSPTSPIALFTKPPSRPRSPVALCPLDMGAVVRGELPLAGLADPRVAANHRARAMRAVEGRIVGELVVCDGGVVPEGRHFHVADPAFGELDGLVLHLLDGVRLGRPLAPAVPLDIG